MKSKPDAITPDPAPERCAATTHSGRDHDVELHRIRSITATLTDVLALPDAPADVWPELALVIAGHLRDEVARVAAERAARTQRDAVGTVQ